MKKRLALIYLISNFLLYQPVTLAVGEITYEEGLNKVQEYIKNSNFREAEDLTKTMLIKYPNNKEFESILAKVLFWEEKYNESISIYEDILKKDYSPEIQAELDKSKTRMEISELKKLRSEISPDEYEQKLIDFYKTGKDRYNGGHILGAYYIENKDFVKATEVFESMHKFYPTDTNISILYLETLLESKNYKTAKSFYNELKEEEEISYINQTRDDLSYKVDRNYALIKGGYYFYQANSQNEKEVSLEISQDYNNFTFAPRYSNISRFGLNDNQFGIDVYSGLGEKRHGYISVTGSPDAEFLPMWTAGAEIYQAIGNNEFSIGYTRMTFKELGVNMIKPGVKVSLPYNTAIEEKLNYIPEQQSYMLTSTFNYEPNHKFNVHYSIGIGQISDRINSVQDLQKVDTYIHTVGLQYRFMPQLSVNTEFVYNHREGLYDIKGASVFTKYWW